MIPSTSVPAPDRPSDRTIAIWLRALVYMFLVGGGWLAGLPALLLYVERHTILPILQPWYMIGIGSAMTLAGVLLALISGHYLIAVGRGTPLPLDPTRYLVTRGPYRYVRNPQAIAMMLMVLGELLMVRSRLLLAMVPLTLIYLEVFAAPLEHKWMRRQFGAEYECYKETVRRWIPGRRVG